MGTARPLRGPLRAGAAIGLLLAAAVALAGAVTDREYESIADQLADSRLELAECQGELGQLQEQLAGLRGRAASPDSREEDQV